MRHLVRRQSLWLALNLAGLIAYLWLASALWVRAGEEGEPGGPGDAFYWLFAVVPVLLVYVAFNLLALIAIVRRAATGWSAKPALFLWAVAVAAWVAAVAYDQHRSMRHIDAKYSWARPSARGA